MKRTLLSLCISIAVGCSSSQTGSAKVVYTAYYPVPEQYVVIVEFRGNEYLISDEECFTNFDVGDTLVVEFDVTEIGITNVEWDKNV